MMLYCFQEGMRVGIHECSTNDHSSGISVAMGGKYYSGLKWQFVGSSGIQILSFANKRTLTDCQGSIFGQEQGGELS